MQAALITLGVYAVAALYFFIYSRHHLVASAPEEEFAAIESAERELDWGMTLDELRTAVAAGTVDTVLLASATCRAGCRASGSSPTTSSTTSSSTAPRAATTCSRSTST